MQGLFSSPRCSSMQALGLSFMTPALRSGDFLLDISIEMTRPKLLTIACGCDVLQAQIEPDFLFRSNRLRHFSCDGQAEPPVSDCVLSKAAGFPPDFLEKLSLEDSKGFA